MGDRCGGCAFCFSEKGKIIMNALTLLGGAAVVITAQKHLEKISGLSKPYIATIRKYAAQYDIAPEIVTALLFKESGFNPDAVGSSGEIGIAQFLPIAAKDIGVDWDSLRNPEKGIEAACMLLSLNKQRTGSLYTAIRAYNVGIGAAQRSADAGYPYAADIMVNAFGLMLFGGIGLV